MAEQKKKRRKIRLVFRHSSLQLKLVVLGCILVSLVALLVIRGSILQAREEKEEARLQAAQLEQENAQLEEVNSLKGTIEGFMRVAKEKLGLLPSGSEVYETQPN